MSAPRSVLVGVALLASWACACSSEGSSVNGGSGAGGAASTASTTSTSTSGGTGGASTTSGAGGAGGGTGAGCTAICTDSTSITYSYVCTGDLTGSEELRNVQTKQVGSWEPYSGDVSSHIEDADASGTITVLFKGYKGGAPPATPDGKACVSLPAEDRPVSASDPGLSLYVKIGSDMGKGWAPISLGKQYDAQSSLSMWVCAECDANVGGPRASLTIGFDGNGNADTGSALTSSYCHVFGTIALGGMPGGTCN